MTLGRTTTGAIKIKTDEAGGGLRAVNCACCGGLPNFTYTWQSSACDESYWTAHVSAQRQDDGSIFYEAGFSSFYEFRSWSKTTAAGEPIDFSGTYIDDYGIEDLTISIVLNSNDCEDKTKLAFSVSGQYYDCDLLSILTVADVFACQI